MASNVEGMSEQTLDQESLNQLLEIGDGFGFASKILRGFLRDSDQRLRQAERFIRERNWQSLSMVLSALTSDCQCVGALRAANLVSNCSLGSGKKLINAPPRGTIPIAFEAVKTAQKYVREELKSLDN